MRRVVIIALVCTALAACGMYGRAINESMSKMVGQPLSVVIAKLGVPNDERVIAGQKVYIWSARTMDEGTEYKCEIRVMTKGDVISSFDYDSDGLCRRYVEKLR